ncbi:MAG: hypothetical protein ABSC23_11685 [Bryobacteraceae bacterium]|jgi:hypothetical protein
MKFFIASPWSNVDAVKSLADAITARGHFAYSFVNNGANLATGRPVCDEVRQFQHSMETWEDDPLIERIFESELQALRESDAVILLEPAGRSSLTEAGIAFGAGKPVILVGPVAHPEVVYRICGTRYPSVGAFLGDLDSSKSSKPD